VTAAKQWTSLQILMARSTTRKQRLCSPRHVPNAYPSTAHHNIIHEERLLTIEADLESYCWCSRGKGKRSSTETGIRRHRIQELYCIPKVSSVGIEHLRVDVACRCFCDHVIVRDGVPDARYDSESLIESADVVLGGERELV
jgi:hypothetical protein